MKYGDVLRKGAVIKLKKLDDLAKTFDSTGELSTKGCYFPMKLMDYSENSIDLVVMEVLKDRVFAQPCGVMVMFDWIDFKESGYEKESNMEVRVEKVIYQNPATVVFWSDGTKTTTKAKEGDVYNPTAGLAICYMKKMLGNAKACDEMARWQPNSDKEVLTYKEANKRDRKRKKKFFS